MNRQTEATAIMVIVLFTFAVWHTSAGVENPLIRFVPETLVYVTAAGLVFAFLCPIQ